MAIAETGPEENIELGRGAWHHDLHSWQGLQNGDIFGAVMGCQARHSHRTRDAHGLAGSAWSRGRSSVAQSSVLPRTARCCEYRDKTFHGHARRERQPSPARTFLMLTVRVYRERIAEAEDERLVLMLGDIGVFGFRNAFAVYPDRTYNIGICEQAMVGVASGMAMEGFIPVLHSIRRSW